MKRIKLQCLLEVFKWNISCSRTKSYQNIEKLPSSNNSLIRMLLHSDKLQNISGKLKINNRKFQNTGNFQNNVIKDAKQISSKGVIRMWIPLQKKIHSLYAYWFTSWSLSYAYVHVKTKTLVKRTNVVANVPLIKPFALKVPFLYPLKTSENRKIFCCFRG